MHCCPSSDADRCCQQWTEDVEKTVPDGEMVTTTMVPSKQVGSGETYIHHSEKQRPAPFEPCSC